jgi:hypothetical protein
MIAPSLNRNIVWTLPLVFSVAFSACEPNAAPPAPSGSPPVSETSRTKAETAPQPSGPSQAEFAKAFDDSTTSLLELKTVEQFSQVKMNAEAVLVPGTDGLAMKVTGNDPVLFLPPFAAGKQFLLKVVIEAPAPTGMQVFYMLRDAPDYTEAHSQTVPLIKGRNVVYFRLNQPDLIDPVRLDPAYTPGDYKIESIAAHEIAKPIAQ